MMTSHTRTDLIHALAIGFVLFALAMMHGCIGAIAAEHLTPEQISALRDYNGDVYACLNLAGPPGSGGGTVIVVPKDKDPGVSFLPACQIMVRP